MKNTRKQIRIRLQKYIKEMLGCQPDSALLDRWLVSYSDFLRYKEAIDNPAPQTQSESHPCLKYICLARIESELDLLEELMRCQPITRYSYELQQR